jgi:hypothetical protein
MLIIDDAGSELTTGATGGYGPQAPQSLCTTAQQWQSGGSGCPAAVALDTSGRYQVAVVPGTSTPAPNVYQGEVGDFGYNSLTFLNVPVLPPAYQGISRTFRITNVRVASAGMSPLSSLYAVLSTSPNQTLPVGGTYNVVATMSNAMTASVDPPQSGGQNPLVACIPPPVPALTAQVTFTEGFSTMFKTRAVPLTNTSWASTMPNTATPGQDVPGSLYNGFGLASESGFIIPAAFANISGLTYTAGLSDYGTRLKAWFTVIPTSATIYVSTTSTNSSTAPGGTSTAPYAVLVANAQSNEGTSDGSAITPLTSATTGSDGMTVYPLTMDAYGEAAAVWEVVNSDPAAIDSLTFNIYVGYSSLGTGNQTYVGLSFAPQPDGASFSPSEEASGLSNPVPRFVTFTGQGGPFATIQSCSLHAAGPSQVSFSYITGGAVPAGQAISVTTSPSNVAVTATPTVTSPSGSHWLTASVGNGTVTISADPTGLAASTLPYAGSVKISAPGTNYVLVSASLQVSSPPTLSITKKHSGYFTAGQLQAAYTITVSNAIAAVSTSDTVTVSENLPSYLTLTGMSGDGWICGGGSCRRSDALAGGGSYAPISVAVNVAANAPASVTNQVTVTGGGSAESSASDPTFVAPLNCAVTGDQTPSLADAQQIVNQSLGIAAATYHFTSDIAVSVTDVQVVVNAIMGNGCQ